MAFVREKADIVLFAGGDGTARDLLGVVDATIPIVGIPTGVKMHSAVFANTPEAAADSIQVFAASRATREAEVMDVDEDGVRSGILRAKLFGYALVPDDPVHMQSSKMTYHSGSARDEAEELGQYVSESLEKGVMYILGPGSTTEAVARELELEKTLLGIDVYLDGRVLAKDASEAKILQLLSGHPDARIVVSPIGAQGFVLGRGNQQLSPEVVRRVGTHNITIIATPTKLRETPVLRVDTGDSALDDAIRGKNKVLTGYKRKKLVTIE
jgi:predicted polyphosphate/ATP-dependent NAD kinase